MSADSLTTLKGVLWQQLLFFTAAGAVDSEMTCTQYSSNAVSNAVGLIRLNRLMFFLS